MVTSVTAHDIERIVQSVLRDYGVAFTLQEIAGGSDVWDVVLKQGTGRPLHIMLAPNSPHGVRRAVMTALKVDG
jgi:hypothetical protein